MADPPGLLRVTVSSRPGRRMRRRDFVIGTNRKRLERAGCGSGPGWSTPTAVRSLRRHGLLEDVGVVVWATGYRPDYGWIHLPDVVGRAMLCTGVV